MLQNEAYRGYNASKKEYFYGFKVEVIATSNGVPVNYFIVVGSVHDAKAFETMHVSLPGGGSLYADSAYTSYEVEGTLAGVRAGGPAPAAQAQQQKGRHTGYGLCQADQEKAGQDLL